MRINAATVQAYLTCPREAWLLHHHVVPDQEHTLVATGRLVHQESYSRKRKEIPLDNLLVIDLMEGEGVIAEVKRTSRHPEAARLQLAYYLYYLKHEKGVLTDGVLLFPKEKKREVIEFTPKLEDKVKQTLEEIKKLVSEPKPPPAKKNKFCKPCGYREMCWG
jgi:CRISPR-associated exonuclease Cas4